MKLSIHRAWRGVVVFAWALCVAAGSSHAAAPLADRVPADAILYIGWRGGDRLGPAYADSHTRAIVEASGIAASLKKLAPQVIDKIGEKDPQAAAIGELIVSVGSTLWSYPAAVYVAMDEIDPKADEPPMPKLAIIVEAGDDAPKVEEQLSQLLEGAPPQFRLVRFAEGRIVFTTMPEGAIDALSGGPGVAGPALAAHAPFAAGLKQTHDEPVLAVYLDTETLLKRMKQLMDAREAQAAEFGAGPPRDIREMRQVLDMLALDGIKRVTLAAGLEGKSWGTSVFVEAPAPRKGLAAMMSGGAIDDLALKVIPKTAAIAGASTLDLAALYDTLHKLAADADADAVADFDAQLAEAEGQIGLKLRDEVLAPFGPQWMYYTDAGVAGTGIGGIVLINKLRDPAKAGASIAKIVEMANAIIAEQIREPGVTLAVKSFDRAGVKVYYTGTPAIAPSWCVHEGYLYVGLQPQVVAGALDFASSGGPPITANASFLKMRMAMRGAGTVGSFGYIDLPQKVNDAYAGSVLLSRYMTGFGDVMGLDMPPMLVPPMSVLKKHLEPSLSLSWADDAGLHIRSREPFPLSGPLGSDPSMGVAGSAMMAGILLPSLGRAKAISERTVSATNLSGMYKAAFQYALNNKDRFPEDVGILVQQGIMSPRNVLHPADMDRLGTFPQAALEDPSVRAWVNENNSYVWRKGADPSDPADAIVAHEGWHIVSQVNHDEGMNLLFGDGHVEFLTLQDAIPAIQRSKLPIPEQYQHFAEEGPGLRGAADHGNLEAAETEIVAAAEAAAAEVKAAAQGKKAPTPPPPGDAYFYDVVKKEYFADKATKIPPIKSAAGNDAIRAHFFTCGECTDEQKFLGYYEKYSPEVKAKIEKNPQSMHFYEEVFRGRFYCPPDADPTADASWVAAETPEGFEIAMKLQEKCPARKLRYCPPPQK